MYLPADLPDLLRAEGLRVVELDGWRTRGRPASTGTFEPVGVLNHHTADSAGGLVYAAWLATTGRPDLPPPLCQLSLGRAGTVYVCAAGRANHAGEARAAGSVAAGDGNRLYVGLEWQLTGYERIPGVMYDAGVAVNVVLLRLLGSTVRTVHCHYETSVTGKWDIGDPNGLRRGDHMVLDADGFRNDVAAELLPRPVVEPDRLPQVSVEGVVLQFRRAHGLEAGRPERTPGVRRVQAALNDRMPRRRPLIVDGRVDGETIDRWRDWEADRVGHPVGRPGVPDEPTLQVLARRSRMFRVVA